MRKFGVAAVAASGMFFSATGALAAGSVVWTSPADGSTFLEGTVVHPEGSASGFGTGGAGLDLAFVLDASGSMRSSNLGKTRQQWQRDAAIALVNSLPPANTSVAVAQFTSSGFLRLGLTSTADTAPIIAAINAVPASGGTAIGAGIVVGATELTTNGAAGRAKQMVVISDGSSSANFVTAATDAAAAGITVHAVAIPGANTTQMQAIATAGGGVFANFTSEADLANIENFFSGAAGSFVGVDQVDITLPDGSVLTDVAVDAFGNFKVPAPGYALALGPNVFTATAFFEDGSSASADLTLNATPIPLPAAAWLLLGGLGGLGLIGRKRRAA